MNSGVDRYVNQNLKCENLLGGRKKERRGVFVTWKGKGYVKKS